jgi:hypothetical protein
MTQHKRDCSTPKEQGRSFACTWAHQEVSGRPVYLVPHRRCSLAQLLQEAAVAVGPLQADQACLTTNIPAGQCQHACMRLIQRT